MAATRQSRPARADQCPGGALIAARPRNAAPINRFMFAAKVATPQAASRPAPLEGEPLRADDEHRPLRDHFIGGVGATIGRPQSARPRKRPRARPYILYHVHRVAGGYRIRPHSKDVEEFRPRRGQYGRWPKSVKKIAALLQFLAFWTADHLFGVPRGE